MPVYKIHHITKYTYDKPVKESVNQIRLFPYHCPEQEVLRHEWNITNFPELHIFNDYWNNRVAVFNIVEPHAELTIESQLMVRTTASNENFLAYTGSRAELEHEMSDNLALLELTSLDLVDSQEEINEIVSAIDSPDSSIAEKVQRCCEYIFTHFQYIKGITDIETTVDEILKHKSGVCQDFAHVMLQLLRTMKIPSRYVSGYICPSEAGIRGEGATHAWVEAWIPGSGWAGIDPTNNLWVTNKHVKLAVGRNFGDCSPVKGTFKGPVKQSLSVYVSIGYEDGHIFEDLNKVNLHLEPPPPSEEEIAEQQAAQQQ
jgi:transglutaminase-like putative cysteine protease